MIRFKNRSEPIKTPSTNWPSSKLIKITYQRLAQRQLVVTDRQAQKAKIGFRFKLGASGEDRETAKRGKIWRVSPPDGAAALKSTKNFPAKKHFLAESNFVRKLKKWPKKENFVSFRNSELENDLIFFIATEGFEIVMDKFPS